MPKKDIVQSHFENVQTNLKDFMNTRHLYYVAHDFMNLLDHCYKSAPGTHPTNLPPKYLIGAENPAHYFDPMVTALYYFITENRMEEAEKIVKSYFHDTPLEKLIKILIPDLEKFGTPGILYPDSRVFLDKVLCFLAQIGYERDILKIPEPLPDSRLKEYITQSWPIWLDRFMNGSGTRHFYKLHIDLLSNLTAYHREAVQNIKENSKMVHFRRWLLKRQMLAIYTIIMLLVENNDTSVASIHDNLIKKMKKLAAETFENYAALICYTTKEYLEAAQKILNKDFVEKYPHLWSGETTENLIHQILHIKNLYSDVGAFFKETLKLDIFPQYPLQLQKKINEDIFKESPHEKLSLELKRLTNGQMNLDEPEIVMGGERLSLTKVCEIIFDKIGTGTTFENYCRNRFTPERLKLLAVSLDNQYSTASSYFFGIPSLKLDGGAPIDTELCVIRKWGSTGGLFERDKYLNASYCGGYLLHHNGFGLMIDPGPDTLNLLNRFTDFDVMDINGVVCTHPHNDHVAEFKRILLGIREYNSQAGYKHLHYLFPYAEDQELIHPKKLEEDYCVNLSPQLNSDAGSHTKQEYYFPNDEWGKKNGIRVLSIPVRHEIYSGQFNSYGLLVSPLKNGEPLTNILFSGDAEYLADGQLFENIPPPYTPEVLVLNITSARMKDILATEPGEQFAFPQKSPKLNHLGYSGVLALLSSLRGQYKVAIISDFFEAQSQQDSRLLINKSLEKDLHRHGHTPPKIYAAEPGMRIRWKEKAPDEKKQDENKFQLEIFCSNLCNVKNKGFVKPDEDNVYQIKRNPHARNEPLVMVCDHCKRIKMEVLDIDKR